MAAGNGSARLVTAFLLSRMRKISISCDPKLARAGSSRGISFLIFFNTRAWADI